MLQAAVVRDGVSAFAVYLEKVGAEVLRRHGYTWAVQLGRTPVWVRRLEVRDLRRGAVSFTLTKDSTVQTANRSKVCPPSFPRPYGGQCDEYPFASTRQGGAGGQAQEVPPRETSAKAAPWATGIVELGSSRESTSQRTGAAHDSAELDNPFGSRDRLRPGLHLL
jgi:hypothetical protein